MSAQSHVPLNVLSHRRQKWARPLYPLYPRVGTAGARLTSRQKARLRRSPSVAEGLTLRAGPIIPFVDEGPGYYRIILQLSPGYRRFQNCLGGENGRAYRAPCVELSK